MSMQKDRPVLTLDDMKKFATYNGKVKMIAAKSFAPYQKGDPFGLLPKYALDEYLAGRAYPDNIKDQITVDTSMDPVPRAPGSIGVSTKSLKRQLGTKLTDQPDLQVVEIPDNWETKEYGGLNRIRLAKRLAGKTKVRMKDQEAIEIIRAELDKRAA